MLKRMQIWSTPAPSPEVSNAWRCEEVGRGEIHVHPVGDLRTHRLRGDTCWCRPAVEDGEYSGMIVTHNALDRREDYESGGRCPS